MFVVNICNVFGKVIKQVNIKTLGIFRNKNDHWRINDIKFTNCILLVDTHIILFPEEKFAQVLPRLRVSL